MESKNEIIMYKTGDGSIKLDVLFSEENSIRKIEISDFSTKPTNFYNLDVIISVGYRMKSLLGTQFLL